jgi:SAM-dependent methyltransferase
MSESFAYTGHELEAMAEAANYRRWILDVFKPYLGNHLVEVGAGLGSFSELILQRHTCQTMSLVEPSELMYQRLVAFTEQLDTRTRVDAFHGTFTAVAAQIKARQAPDSIIYVNVLEHVADDDAELAAVHQTLANNGRVLIFVPALAWLYGSFDERVSHFRRYARTNLAEKVRRAGFTIVRSAYFDLPGVVPWWIKYRLLRSKAMAPGGVRLYDRFFIPTVRRLETRFPPPLGKNIIMVGQKIQPGRSGEAG